VGRIVICEPDPEVRALLGHVVARLGREPSAGGDGADVVEPADPLSLAHAIALVKASPGLPVVCASIEAPNGKTGSLNPSAYLVKPFALPELERALRDALLRASSPDTRNISAA
jgi:CheY-like chemotaxis protein